MPDPSTVILPLFTAGLGLSLFSAFFGMILIHLRHNPVSAQKLKRGRFVTVKQARVNSRAFRAQKVQSPKLYFRDPPSDKSLSFYPRYESGQEPRPIIVNQPSIPRPQPAEIPKQEAETKSTSIRPSGVIVERYDRPKHSSRPREKLTTKEKYMRQIIKDVKKENEVDSIPDELREMIQDCIDDTLTLNENFDLLRRSPELCSLKWPE